MTISLRLEVSGTARVNQKGQVVGWGDSAVITMYDQDFPYNATIQKIKELDHRFTDVANYLFYLCWNGGEIDESSLEKFQDDVVFHSCLSDALIYALDAYSEDHPENFAEAVIEAYGERATRDVIEKNFWLVDCESTLDEPPPIYMTVRR